MSAVEFAPVELIPVVQMPDEDVRDVNNCDSIGNYSYLFPQLDPEDFQGSLGDYRAGHPPPDSNLYPLLCGIRAYRHEIYKQEAADDWVRTEERSKTLWATMFQTHLVTWIDKGFRNLTDNGTEPVKAVAVIEKYIEDKDTQVANGFNDEIDRMLAQLAAFERGDFIPEAKEAGGIPIITARTLALGGDLSPEEQRQVNQDYLGFEVEETRLRLARLAFEWSSAVAITRELRQTV